MGKLSSTPSASMSCRSDMMGSRALAHRAGPFVSTDPRRCHCALPPASTDLLLVAGLRSFSTLRQGVSSPLSMPFWTACWSSAPVEQPAKSDVLPNVYVYSSLLPEDSE